MKLSHLVLALVVASGAAATSAAAQAPHAAKPASADAQLPNKGTVLTVTDVPSYTYIEVQFNKQNVWLAAPTVKVKKGDVIRFDIQMEMTDFKSTALKKTFKSILFVGKVVVTNEKA